MSMWYMLGMLIKTLTQKRGQGGQKIHSALVKDQELESHCHVHPFVYELSAECRECC